MVIKAFLGHSLQDDITEGVYTSITTELRDKTASIVDNFVDSIYTRAVAGGVLVEPHGRNGKLNR